MALSIIRDNNTIGVADNDGGIWWPDEATEDEINASDDPEALALRLCEDEPTRGTWHC